MASGDKQLEEQLLEAGTELLDPPSFLDELLYLLDRVECCLSRVNQSPTKSMQIALSPLLKALTADELMRHSDVDVRVAVASCLSEITRIMAPDPPYDDNQMKEVFQLIVSSLENLSDKSSRSYTKRTSILNTIALVRSCLVMLDLQSDNSLIVEMFQHFLKEIREYHPENVLLSMETIMTLVLEESDNVTLDLLSPILASAREDKEGVSPAARKLWERVLKSSATVEHLIKKTISLVEKEVAAKDEIKARLEKEVAAKDEIVARLGKEVAACGERVTRLEFEVERLQVAIAHSASHMLWLFP